MKMKQGVVSKRLGNVPASPIRKLVPYAQSAKKNGVTIYHLNIGDPDIKTPKVILDALKNWKQDPIGYSQSQGEPIFLEAMKTYYHRLGHTFIDTRDIQITVGGSEAIAMALFAVCEAGEEVICFEPFYTNYNSYAAINDVKIAPILTSSKNGFHLPNKKTIAKKITKKTKAILICNPSNPTGTVYTKEEIEMLVDLSKEYGLFLLSDEVYREFVYDGKEHVSLFRFMEDIPKQAIILDSLSKRYSLCGARLGTLVSLNHDIMDGVLRIAQGRLSAGLVDQIVSSELVNIPSSYTREVIKEYKKRRDVLYDGLRKIPGVFIPKPEGAFYTIVTLPVADSEDFCRWLLTDFRLHNKTVMLAPAPGFYATKGSGANQVRIAYVLNVDDLKQAIKIIQKALQQYKK